MAVELDRRSYFGLSRARFTVAGAEPRPAFRRLGTLRPALKEELRRTPEGAAGARLYHRLLFLGYLCSVLAALLAGAAAAAFLGREVLDAMRADKELTPFLDKLLHLALVLPLPRLAGLAAVHFLLALALDFLAYKSILGAIDKS